MEKKLFITKIIELREEGITWNDLENSSWKYVITLIYRENHFFIYSSLMNPSPSIQTRDQTNVNNEHVKR